MPLFSSFTVKTTSLGLFAMLISSLSPSVTNAQTKKTHKIAKPKNCNRKGITNVDVAKPVNLGELDDRTCAYNYKEVTFKGSTTTWGAYQIAAGSNNADKNGLSPRMERKFRPRPKAKDGNYQKFSGTFRIESVSGGRGTYFIQVKGKHQGHTNPDPAICLIIAKKVKQEDGIYFYIYSEQITKRDGRFSNNGRKDVYLTRVKKGEAFNLELETGFIGTPVNTHYVHLKVKDKIYNWNVPQPELALETAIRYGAYGITSGVAEIYVSNTSFSDKR